MLRVALLADTHGHLDPRIAALVAECDLAIHGGDIGNADVLSQLQPRSGRVHAVLGNNDVPHKWPEHQRALLASIPWEARVELPGGLLVVVHGHRLPAANRHARLRERYSEARVVIYGHSHRLVADREARPWVLNPGAAGRERTHGGPACMVLNAAEHGWTLAVHRFDLHPSAATRRVGGHHSERPPGHSERQPGHRRDRGPTPTGPAPGGSAGAPGGGAQRPRGGHAVDIAAADGGPAAALGRGIGGAAAAASVDAAPRLAPAPKLRG